MLGILLLIFIVLVALVNTVAAIVLTGVVIALLVWSVIEPGPRAPARKRRR